jgi:hypothetical protein
MSTVKRPSFFTLPMIGWKEHVNLPDLGLTGLVAKVDTGARSAALHADDIAVRGKRVRFSVPVNGRRHWQDFAVAGVKRVKSSSGHTETRVVILTHVDIGVHRHLIEVTLTNRQDMGVPMLLGRASVRGHFVVHPGKSFILSKKTKRRT